VKLLKLLQSFTRFVSMKFQCFDVLY